MDKIKQIIRNSLEKECDKLGIKYSESDTNSDLCTKINNK